MANVERKDTKLHKKTLRLNKYLAMAGVGSRRKNDELIAEGLVKVNGKTVIELGAKVDPGKDRVSVRGHPVQLAQKSLYIVLNKPKDCITTMNDEKDRPTVMEYVRTKDRVYPIGRLDRNTTGALLFTNEGELAHALTHPSFELEKVYHVRVDGELTDIHLRKLRHGIRLEDGRAKASRIDLVPHTHRSEIMVAVHEGRNRLIRRMFESLGFKIKKLDRLSFCGISTVGLARGEWRYLSRPEINALRALAGLPPNRGMNQ